MPSFCPIKDWQKLTFQEIVESGKESVELDLKALAYNKYRFIKSHKKAYDDLVDVIKKENEHSLILIRDFEQCTMHDIKALKSYVEQKRNG